MPQLTFELSDAGVATVTISNPPLQVMTPTTVNELNAMLPRLSEDDVRAVVFVGDGDAFFIRHFSVEELSASTKGQGGKWDANMDDVLLAMENLPKPVIAALNGSAAGGGLEFAMACDIRVAKDGPFRFGLPEVSVGILPGAGGTQRLPALVGRNRALEMMLRARLVSPAQALQYGLIEELVPADSRETALQRAQAIALEIAQRPPRAVAHIKALARAAVSPVSPELLKRESVLFADLMKTPEARELMSGVAADHRKARETGSKATDLE
nr:enoyl-CoA hydratase-related protein [Hyphomonas sp. Mor2]